MDNAVLQAELGSVCNDTTIQLPGTVSFAGKTYILNVDDQAIPIIATTPCQDKWMGAIVGVTKEKKLVVTKITTNLATYATQPGPNHTVQRGWHTDDTVCTISPSMVAAVGSRAIVNFLRRENLQLCSLVNGLWVPIETVETAPVVAPVMLAAPVAAPVATPVATPVAAPPVPVDPQSAIHDFQTRYNGRYRWRKNKNKKWYHVVFWAPNHLLDDVFKQNISDGQVFVIQYGDDGPFGDYWRVPFSKLEKM